MEGDFSKTIKNNDNKHTHQRSANLDINIINELCYFAKYGLSNKINGMY